MLPSYEVVDQPAGYESKPDEIDDPISEQHVERRAILQEHPLLQDLLSLRTRRCKNSSVRVNHPGDAPVRGLSGEASGLDGAEDRLGKVLLQRFGPFEPSIVGDDEERLGAVFDKRPPDLGEDRLKADGGRYCWGDLHRPEALPRRQRPQRERPDEILHSESPHEPDQGEILRAEGHKLHFIIEINPPCRSDQRRRIEEFSVAIVNRPHDER